MIDWSFWLLSVSFALSAIIYNHFVGGALLSAVLRQERNAALVGLAEQLAGFMAMAFIGCMSWLLNGGVGVVAMLLFCSFAVSLFFALERKNSSQDWPSTYLIWWGTLLLVLVTGSSLLVREPDSLVDGPYPFKYINPATRIQIGMLDMPADNALPAYVTEYLARNVSFRQHSPIMPGQEVSNRPILTSFVLFPFRLVFGGEINSPNEIPKLSYVGGQWPDIGPLISKRSWAVAIALTIALNSTLFLALAALAIELGLSRRLALLSAVIYAVSPYFLLHTIFTWPKNIAASLITLSLLLYLRPGVRDNGMALVIVAIAFHFHPYALPFVGAFWCVWAVDYEYRRRVDRSPFKIGYFLYPYGASLAVLLLWPLWRFFNVDADSNLISQNLGSHTSFNDLLRTRWLNLSTVFRVDALSIIVPTTKSELHVIFTSLPGALGVFYAFLPGALVAGSLLDRERAVIILALLLPPALAITFIFGVVNPPMNHGWQAALPGLYVYSLVILRQYLGNKALCALVLINLLLFLGWNFSWFRLVSSDNVLSVFLRPANVSCDRSTHATQLSQVDIYGETTRVLFQGNGDSDTFGPFVATGQEYIVTESGVHPEVISDAARGTTEFRVFAFPVPRTTSNDSVLLSASVKGFSPHFSWEHSQAPVPILPGKTYCIKLECDAGTLDYGDWCLWRNVRVVQGREL